MIDCTEDVVKIQNEYARWQVEKQVEFRNFMMSKLCADDITEMFLGSTAFYGNLYETAWYEPNDNWYAVTEPNMDTYIFVGYMKYGCNEIKIHLLENDRDTILIR